MRASVGAVAARKHTYVLYGRIVGRVAEGCVHGWMDGKGRKEVRQDDAGMDGWVWYHSYIVYHISYTTYHVRIYHIEGWYAWWVDGWLVVLSRQV